MRMNQPVDYAPVHTAEGGQADRIAPVKELRRLVLSCLLWEDGFYETGKQGATRIAELCTHVKPQEIAELAIEARERMHLRHVPLFLVVQLTKHRGQGALVAHVLERVIQRADELSEVLALYWAGRPQSGGRRQGGALSHRGMKRGLAGAFARFNEYQLAKYNRDAAVKLRDVLFLCHAKARDSEQQALWKRLVAGELAVPDTWEVELSAGKDKRETFERLLREKKLGGLAVLRNLRNMQQAGVDEGLIRERLEQGAQRVLPFRFITAARYAPQLEPSLETGMYRALQDLSPLQGRTGLLVDVSGSMNQVLSARSETLRVDAACGLAILVRQLSEQSLIATFSNNVVEVPARRGFALRDAILQSQPHSGTYLKRAVESLSNWPSWQHLDRLIVITDEQSADGNAALPTGTQGYVVNVGTSRNGVSYSGGWTHIDGWSESVIQYIQEIEQEKL